jgi:hypothetical protein
MDKSRKRLLLGALAAAIAIGIAFLVMTRKETPDVPKGSGYYTGPLRNKVHPEIYGDVNGNMVPAPPGDAPATPVKPKGQSTTE